MRVLIDTNIFIDREDDHVLPEDIKELSRSLRESSLNVLTHPASIDDIMEDENENRRKVSLSKIEAYPKLTSPSRPENSDAFYSSIEKPKDNNELIDDKLLCAVYEDKVDFLITKDGGIHYKAEQLGIGDRVLGVNKALEILGTNEEVDRTPPSFKDTKVHQLDVGDPIFDSLKEDYPFKQWFKRISREGRQAWVHRKENGNLGAILIYKYEDAGESDLSSVSGKVFKICTFKVAEDMRGNKIGELLIKLAIQRSIEQGMQTLYLTVYPKWGGLIQLIKDYGFYKDGSRDKYDDEELVFRKEVFPSSNPDLDAGEISEKYYPSYYDGKEVDKFIVPIKPEYHNRLFTDYSGRQTGISEFMGETIIEGNTIRKAYLSLSNIHKISAGDVLLFYRSRDVQAITSIGIVDEVNRMSNRDSIIKKVGKRTVYEPEVIQEMVQGGRDPLVCLFTFNFHLSNELKRDQLKEENVIEEAPMSIMEIGEDSYYKIKELGGIDERFTIN